MKEMDKTCARFLNQSKFIDQTMFSARLYKLDEDDQLLEEIE